MLTWENKETGELVDSETAWRHHCEYDQYVFTPRWNGLPARWYTCAHCGFQMQLKARFPSGGEAMGRYIVHPCPGGVDNYYQSGEKMGQAGISNPWRAIEQGLQALYGRRR